MKPTELMMGDWLRVSDVPTNIESKIGKCGKVAKLEQYHNYSGIAIKFDNELDTYFCEKEEELESIPLTPEILKKSGFEHLVTEEDSDSFDGAQGDLCYVFNKTPEGYMSCVDMTHSFTITGRIKYVHELQHILRLCGIEKEIVLDTKHSQSL